MSAIKWERGTLGVSSIGSTSGATCYWYVPDGRSAEAVIACARNGYVIQDLNTRKLYGPYPTLEAAQFAYEFIKG